MGLALASGVNTYLPLFALAMLARFGNVVHVSPKFQWLVSDQAVIILAILAVCEILADKFPGLDHVWDFIHTLLRPVAGALAAGATLSTDRIFEMLLIMLTGASLATAAHSAKASVRLVSTSKGLGVANPFLSVLEDVAAVVATLLSVFTPWLMLVIVLLFVAAFALLGPPLLRTLRFNLGAIFGWLRWCVRKLARKPAPRELRESLLDMGPGRLRALGATLESGEELLGVLSGWKRTGWGPRRTWLLITPRRILLAERRLLGGIKAQVITYPELLLVRERESLLLARLECVTRQNQSVTVLLPKTQAVFAVLGAKRICEFAQLGAEPPVPPPSKLEPVTL
jgi:uncharacterized membrane protein